MPGLRIEPREGKPKTMEAGYLSGKVHLLEPTLALIPFNIFIILLDFYRENIIVPLSRRPFT